MNEEQKKMWAKLQKPWYEGPVKFSLSDDGKTLYKDLYGDGTEVDIYTLSTPFNISTGTYSSTDYCSAWGMT